MREAEKDPRRLHDILEAIDHIISYVGNDNYQSFLSDVMRYHAIVYNLMIIGEAANLLTKDFCLAHPATPWKQIIGMRNFLIHGYQQVEKDVVWEVLSKDIHLLRTQIIDYLQDLQ